MLDLAARASRPTPCPASPDVFTWVDVAQHDPSYVDTRVVELPDVGCFQRCEATASKALLSDSPLESNARRWMAQIQSRDESALRQLHAAFCRRVFACAFGIVRREEVAHEIVSISFMQVWNNAMRYDPHRGPVVTWLLLIARTRSLDELRHAKARRQHEVGIDDVDPQQELAGDAMLEPLVHLERRKRGARLQRALSKLSPIQRQVLSLTSLDGLSQDEASRHLNIPLGTIKSHARRGLVALRLRCEATGLSCD